MLPPTRATRKVDVEGPRLGRVTRHGYADRHVLQGQRQVVKHEKSKHRALFHACCGEQSWPCWPVCMPRVCC